MRERKGADRKDLAIAGGFLFAVIFSVLTGRQSFLDVLPFLVGGALGFWLILTARKRRSDRRQ